MSARSRCESSPAWLAVALVFSLGGASSAQEPNDRAESLPYKYVGNNFSLKFHRPSCPFARAMSVSHVELFHFRRDAVEAGQKPCRYCLPADWKTVRLKVLPRGDCPPAGESPPADPPVSPPRPSP